MLQEVLNKIAKHLHVPTSKEEAIEWNKLSYVTLTHTRERKYRIDSINADSGAILPAKQSTFNFPDLPSTHMYEFLNGFLYGLDNWYVKTLKENDDYHSSQAIYAASTSG